MPQLNLKIEGTCFAELEEQLGFKKEAYLQRKGWKHTSNTPSSHWLWEKKIADGRTILVDRDFALAVQNGADYLHGDDKVTKEFIVKPLY